MLELLALLLPSCGIGDEVIETTEPHHSIIVGGVPDIIMPISPLMSVTSLKQLSRDASLSGPYVCHVLCRMYHKSQCATSAHIVMHLLGLLNTLLLIPM